MRKSTYLLLTAALLFAGVGGVKARTNIDMSTATAGPNATWTEETNTFAWSAENAYIVIPGLSGDLTGCYLDFTIGDACHIDIVDTDDHVKNGGWNGYGRFGGGGSKTQDLGFMVSGSDCDITKVKEVRICSQSASGSLTITSVSYYFPLKLDFDASGVATVPFKSIITSGGVTFENGVVTNTNGEGYLAIELPNAGIDLSTIKRIDVTYTGEEDVYGDNSNRVLGNLEISNVNTWQGSRYSCNLSATQDGGTQPWSAKAGNVTYIRWNAGGKTNGTITISSIQFSSEFVSCAKAGETVLNTLPWIKISDGTSQTPAWNVGTLTDTYYGTGEGTNAVNYVDLTEYEELRIYRDANTGFRAFFIKPDGTKVNEVNAGSSSATWYSTEKYWSIDLSKVDKYNNMVALQSIKSENYNVSNIVNNIVVYKVPAAGTAQYLITGKGLLDNATTSLLADATVTSIDATGMTNITATKLTSANPNCLFKANSGKLSNTNNVIVSDACAQLAISDAYPFKAPAAFTATAAPTYNRTFTASTTTTVCLPFALTSAEAATLGTFYELSSFDGSTLHFTSVDAPEANKAYIVVPTSTGLTLSETGKSIVATPADLGTSVSDVAFIGTLAATEIPASDGTYSYYAYNNGSLVKVASNAATLPAFRAYFKVLNSAIGAARDLSITFDDESMGINNNTLVPMTENTYYDLQGRRVNAPDKGLYIVRSSGKNGKRIIKK